MTEQEEKSQICAQIVYLKDKARPFTDKDSGSYSNKYKKSR